MFYQSVNEDLTALYTHTGGTYITSLSIYVERGAHSPSPFALHEFVVA